jgi:hypothetical protein
MSLLRDTSFDGRPELKSSRLLKNWAACFSFVFSSEMRSKCSVSVVFVLLESDSELVRTHVDPDLHRRNCGGEIAHTHQIVGRRKQR